MIYTPPMLQSDWPECYNHGTRTDIQNECGVSTNRSLTLSLEG